LRSGTFALIAFSLVARLSRGLAPKTRLPCARRVHHPSTFGTRHTRQRPCLPTSRKGNKRVLTL
jgi:hypothetical protein